MDNSVMIYCGDWIDMTIGVSFGFSTLTAAAFGQLFRYCWECVAPVGSLYLIIMHPLSSRDTLPISDTSGVLFGGVVERIAESLNLPKPGLNVQQLQLASVKRVTTLGAVLGVIRGCLLGRVQLLLKDTGKAGDLKKQAELESIFQLCMTVGGQDLRADRCSLFLLDTDQQELYSLVRTQKDSTASWRTDDTEIRMPVTAGIAGHTVRAKTLINIRDAQCDSRFNNAFDKKTGYTTQSVLCAPIFDPQGEVMGVIQAMNKSGGGGKVGVFTTHDERMMTMLAEHVSLCVKAVMMDEDEDELESHDQRSAAAA
jgi:hypothetical protein